MVKTDEILAILSTIEGKTIQELQTPDALYEYLVQLTGWLAFSGEQQAIAGREYNKAKRQAYFNLEANYRATGHELRPMLAKDFVASQCHEEAYNYELCERCNRCIVHALDSMRSILSSMKSEMSNMRYG